MTGANGYPVWSATYLPFGYELNPEMTENHYKFTAKERDSESGLDYFGARHYASTMGRFMTPDWSSVPDTVPYADLNNPQSLNLYNYVLNNPLNSTDPDGHTHQECDPDTWNSETNTLTGGACHDVPDWWNVWDNFQNRRQNFVNDWNQRIAAHQPPPQHISNNQQLLQDINNIMMGMVPVGYSARFGYRGTLKWRKAAKELMRPGTHETVAGEVPTRAEATQMIQESGGTIQRGAAGEPMDAGEEFGHAPGGDSTHTYPHINYTTPSGMKGTVKVQP